MDADRSLPDRRLTMRPATADDYDEPLASMIRRGECEPPDEMVIGDALGPRAFDEDQA